MVIEYLILPAPAGTDVHTSDLCCCKTHTSHTSAQCYTYPLGSVAQWLARARRHPGTSDNEPAKPFGTAYTTLCILLEELSLMSFRALNVFFTTDLACLPSRPDRSPFQPPRGGWLWDKVFHSTTYFLSLCPRALGVGLVIKGSRNKFNHFACFNHS